ncbi:MAG TPA: molybdopterin-dependent oxidoreductase [Gammaproteobacteria bacterium]|nr:molybdopterin-dependent oxidoreductase [Gammaproteobacteria bacterium]
MSAIREGSSQWVPSYCYNCVAGPDLMTVKVEDGIATQIRPNFEAEGVHPAQGRVCVKAFGLIQKTYNPHRIRTPMRRTNPCKGRDEDPGFVPISWDEALDEIAGRLKAIRARGLRNEQGYPRVAATFGHGGTPQSYMGTLPAFLSAWGPMDFSFGSGQGVKCVHAEHVYGEYWHRAFTVCADTVNTRYIVSFGANTEASGGACAVYRHAQARMRGIKRVQVEPHLSVTAAASAEWVPIKPKTDPAFMFAMIHVLVFEHPRESLDVAFLRDRTASPYLVGPNGYYLREPESRKPLVWDSRTGRAVAHDTPDAVPALEGEVVVPSAVEVGPDDTLIEHRDVPADTAFTVMAKTMEPYTPEWAAGECDLPAETIRRVANEYLENACVGETIEVEGQVLPYRPVAVTLGKTVNNGWGAYHCVWSRTVLATLVGALEVPGGTLGTTIRLNRPHENRLLSVKPGEDGFMAARLNATDREHWENPADPEHWDERPSGRNAHKTLVPIVGNSAWSQALGPTHLAWMFLRKAPENWPKPIYPDLWFVYRTNPAISFWDTGQITEIMSRMPFVVAFAYTRDETNHMADILLPDATDLESMQLIPVGGTKYVEQHWDYQGVALRCPAVAPQGEARDMTWIAGELARRTGLAEDYYQAINRGASVVPLKGEGYDFTLDPAREHDVEEIWDAACRAATAEFSRGKEVRGLDWFREHGFYLVPFKRADWYLYPTMLEKGLRFELPYQERLKRVGKELEARMHEAGYHWWDEQLKDYEAIPTWHDFPGLWIRQLEKSGGRADDYPLWAITTKSMQYTTGNNVAIQLMDEVGSNVRGTGRVIINTRTAERYGIAQGDRVEVRSMTGATVGRAELMQGVRPDTVVIPAQFGQWATPYAKDREYPSLNRLSPLSLDLTDSSGSGADVVRVAVRRLGGAS